MSTCLSAESCRKWLLSLSLFPTGSLRPRICHDVTPSLTPSLQAFLMHQCSKKNILLTRVEVKGVILFIYSLVCKHLLDSYWMSHWAHTQARAHTHIRLQEPAEGWIRPRSSQRCPSLQTLWLTVGCSTDSQVSAGLFTPEGNNQEPKSQQQNRILFT